MYRRINITGNAGAGKSTAAVKIGQLLKLPIYGLDSVVWKPGWKQAEAKEKIGLIEDLVDKNIWVIDGVSKRVREEADLVIFLDIPRKVCVYQCLKRNWRYLFRSRPGLPNNCPEILIMPTLLKIIWNFPNIVKPVILSEMQNSNKYRHVTSYTQLENILLEITI